MKRPSASQSPAPTGRHYRQRRENGRGLKPGGVVELCELAGDIGRHTPIPAILHQRLSIDWSDKENRPPLPRASGMAGSEAHWLDKLEAGVKTHIQAMQQKRDELAAQARPPQAVLDVALTD